MRATALLNAAAAASVPVTLLDIENAEARDLYGCDLVLIRPDQHVGWRGNAEPADAERLVARLVGASRYKH